MDYRASNQRRFEFNKIYNKEILPKIQFYENIRQKAQGEFQKKANQHKIFIILSAIYIILFFIYIIFFNGYLNNFHYGITMLTIGLLIISLSLVILLSWNLFEMRRKTNMEFKKDIKKSEVFPELLKPFGNITWHANNIVKLNSGKEILSTFDIEESGLFVRYNSRYTDDEFSGIYKGVKFKISETKMLTSYERESYKKAMEQSEQIPMNFEFEGIIISFDTNKKINNRTIVATKRDFTAKNQAIYSALMAPLFVLGSIRPPRHMSDGSWKFYLIMLAVILVGSMIVAYCIEKKKEKKEEPLNRVILEDTQFSNRFKVYSSDQVEARYLVTPAFMERLYNLKTAFGSKNVKCSFFCNQLMIAISTKKDLFEICCLEKHTSQVVRDFYKELNSIYELIDYFKLDEKIFPTN